MSRVRSNVQHDGSIVHLLYRADLRADELFTFFVGYSGPSSPQCAVLMAVARSKGSSQAEIVRSTGIDRSTTSEIVRRLVRKGWLRRRRAKDARAYAVQLTVAGRKVARMGESAAWEADEAVMAALPSNRRATFMDTLGKIVEAHQLA
jgi:DNA-binding MarR family transcriptional regulator